MVGGKVVVVLGTVVVLEDEVVVEKAVVGSATLVVVAGGLVDGLPHAASTEAERAIPITLAAPAKRGLGTCGRPARKERVRIGTRPSSRETSRTGCYRS